MGHGIIVDLWYVIFNQELIVAIIFFISPNIDDTKENKGKVVEKKIRIKMGRQIGNGVFVVVYPKSRRLIKVRSLPSSI